MARQRQRNFWGWGWADKFPDAEGRQTLGQQVSAMLGFEGLELLEPPSLDDIELRPPRVEPPAALANICTTNKRQRATHTYGKAYRDVVRGFHAQFDAPPDFVVRPRRAQQVRQVLDWASDNRVAVVPFGGGTAWSAASSATSATVTRAPSRSTCAGSTGCSRSTA